LLLLWISCLDCGFIVLLRASAARSRQLHRGAAWKTGGRRDGDVQADAKGFESTSIVHVSMQGLNYAISKDEELTAANQTESRATERDGEQHRRELTATRDNAQFLLNVSANGRSSTLRLASHPAAVFLPDFDPGALDTLLALAPPRTAAYLWALFPSKRRPGRCDRACSVCHLCR